MNIEEFRDYCLSFDSVTEEFPFGEDVLVYKSGGKIFAMSNIGKADFEVNLKCDPEMALALREEYDAVKPGYHMNKKHWNTVQINGTISDKLLKEFINNSYSLIVNKNKKHKV